MRRRLGPMLLATGLLIASLPACLVGIDDDCLTATCGNGGGSSSGGSTSSSNASGTGAAGMGGARGGITTSQSSASTGGSGGTGGGNTGGSAPSPCPVEAPDDDILQELPAPLDFDPREAPPEGRVVHATDLQLALDNAKAGDVILLPPGRALDARTYVLPSRPEDDTGWIVIRTDGVVPPAGTRVASTPDRLAVLEAPTNGPAIRAEPGAHHYRIEGIEVRAAQTQDVLLRLGDGDVAYDTSTPAPHHLVLDRVYVHGALAASVQNGIELNGASTAVIDSWVSDLTRSAIRGSNGPGPFLIENNHLESAWYGAGFGESAPATPNLVPSDITIARNHIVKWAEPRAGWEHRRLVLLNSAKRALVHCNVLRYSRSFAAFAIFPAQNPSNNQELPTAVVESVTVVNNRISDVAAAFQLSGGAASAKVTRVVIRNNLFDGVDAQWGPNATGQFADAWIGITSHVKITQNTVLQTARVLSASGSHEAFFFDHNIMRYADAGVTGEGHSAGTDALTFYFPGFVPERFIDNLLFEPPRGFNPATYPPDNFFPSSVDDIGFEDPSIGDYRLRADSQYKIIDPDPGADIDVLEAATAGVKTP